MMPGLIFGTLKGFGLETNVEEGLFLVAAGPIIAVSLQSSLSFPFTSRRVVASKIALLFNCKERRSNTSTSLLIHWASWASSLWPSSIPTEKYKHHEVSSQLQENERKMKFYLCLLRGVANPSSRGERKLMRVLVDEAKRGHDQSLRFDVRYVLMIRMPWNRWAGRQIILAGPTPGD